MMDNQIVDSIFQARFSRSMTLIKQSDLEIDRKIGYISSNIIFHQNFDNLFCFKSHDSTPSISTEHNE